MKTYHIDDFRCMLCREWFNPPYNLPYLLKCTHSICSKCLNHHISNKSNQIICCQDYQVNYVTEINLNTVTKRALERLIKQHKNYNQNAQLVCIQTLTQSFDEVLQQKRKVNLELAELLDKIFSTEIARLMGLHEKLKEQLGTPQKIASDWKDMVRNYLNSIKSNDGSIQSKGMFNELNSFIEQGRKIKIQLAQYRQFKYENVANQVIINPCLCFDKLFQIFGDNYRVKQEEQIQARQIMKLKDISCSMKIQEKQKERIYQPTQLNISQYDFLRPTEDTLEIQRESWNKQIKQNNRSNKQNQCRQGKGRNAKQTNKLKIFDSESSASHKEAVRYQNKCDYNTKKQNRPNDNQSSGMSKSQMRKQLKQERLLIRNHRKQLGMFENLIQNIASQDDMKHLFTYSPDYDVHIEKVKDFNQCEQLLLSQTDDHIHQQDNRHINFLKEWEISQNQQNEELQVKKKIYYNCQKEKNSYIRRMEMIRVQQARQKTLIKDNCISLINYSLHQVDLRLYFQKFDWNHIQTIKLVNTSMNDHQFNQLLNWILNSGVTTLVLSGNCLDEISLDALLHFVKISSQLKNVCLSKNNINVLKGQSKAKINLLREMGISMYI